MFLGKLSMSPRKGLQVVNVGSDGFIPMVQSAANLGFKVKLIGEKKIRKLASKAS